MKSSRKITFHAECENCGGTGLYRGFMEAPDKAVVCITCRGTGCNVLNLKPFEGRKKKRGVKKFRFGSGTILNSPSSPSGRDYEWFPYKEFLKKVPEMAIKAVKKVAKKK